MLHLQKMNPDTVSVDTLNKILEVFQNFNYKKFMDGPCQCLFDLGMMATNLFLNILLQLARTEKRVDSK